MSHEVIPCHRRPHGAKPESRSGHVSVAYGPCIYVWGGYHELQVYIYRSSGWEWPVTSREHAGLVIVVTKV